MPTVESNRVNVTVMVEPSVFLQVAPTSGYVGDPFYFIMYVEDEFTYPVEGAIVELMEGASVIASGFSDASGACPITWIPTPLDVGVHTFYARATW